MSARKLKKNTNEGENDELKRLLDRDSNKIVIGGDVKSRDAQAKKMKDRIESGVHSRAVKKLMNE